MADESFDQLTRNFLAWFTSAALSESGTHIGPAPSTPDSAASISTVPSSASAGPVATSPVDIVDRRSQGRGRAVVATRDLAPDTSLFTISHSYILSLDTSSVRQLLSASQESALPPWAACVLALIFEHGRGAGGKWWPYLSILPESFDTLMHWSDEQLKELQGSKVVEKIGRDGAEEAIKEHLWPVVRLNAQHFGTHAEALSNPNEEEALLALFGLAHRFASLVLAYAFDLDQDEGEVDLDGTSADEEELVEETAPPKGMVPFADMLNAEGEELNNARLFHGEGSVSMVTTRAIKAGEEILNDYGSLPNAELLRCYGYTAAAYDQYDVAELETESLVEIAKVNFELSDKQVDKRLDLAERWDVADDSFDLMRNPGKESPLDKRLIATAMLLTSTDDEYRGYKQMKKPPPARINAKTARLLEAATQQRQHEYKSSIAEDKVLLAKTTGAKQLSRLALALKVRLGEKEILAQNLQYLRDIINLSGEISPDNGEPEQKRMKP